MSSARSPSFYFLASLLLLLVQILVALEDVGVDAVQPQTCTRAMGRRVLVERARAQVLPKVLHQIVLEGASALDQWAREATTGYQRSWQTSCVVHNPGWLYRLWTEEDAIALIQKDYGWLEDLYTSYSTVSTHSLPPPLLLGSG